MARRKSDKKIKPIAEVQRSEQSMPVAAVRKPAGWVRLWLFNALGVIVLFVMTLCVYLPSMHGEFFMDDDAKIVLNKDIHDWQHVWSKLVYPYKKHMTPDEQAHSFERNDPSRPVVYLSFAINYHLGKLNPFGYHLVNMLFHFLNALLIWMLSQLVWSLIFKQKMSFFPFIIAIFYAVHPINTSTVSYVFSRSDVLSTFFTLSAMLLFARVKSGKGDRYVSYALSCICFILALYSKQLSATFPLVLLLFDYMVLSDFRVADLLPRKFYHLGYWSILLLYLLTRYLYFGQLGDLEATAPWSPYYYFISQPFSIVKYLQMILVPVGLCTDHGIMPSFSILEAKVILSWLFLLAVIAATIWAWRKQTSPAKLAVFYICWFFANIAPTTSFLPTAAVVVDNRVYLPGMGWAGLLILTYYMLWRAASRSSVVWRVAILAVVVVHLGILSTMAYHRNTTFRTKLSVLTDVVTQYPNVMRDMRALGELYYHIYKNNDKALECYTKVLAICAQTGEQVPQMIHHNIGAIYQQRYDDSQQPSDLNNAISEYVKDLQLNPGSDNTHKNLAGLYYLSKQYDKAIAEYEKTVQLNPRFEQAYYELGVLYLDLNNTPAALVNFTKAAEIDPKDTEALNNSAACYIRLNKIDKALAILQQTVKVDPTFQRAYVNMLNIYTALHQTDKQHEIQKKLDALQYSRKE